MSVDLADFGPLSSETGASHHVKGGFSPVVTGVVQGTLASWPVWQSECLLNEWIIAQRKYWAHGFNFLFFITQIKNEFVKGCWPG